MNIENTIDSDIPGLKQSPAHIAFKWGLIGMLISVIQTLAMYYINDQKYDPRAGGTANMLLGIAISFFIIFMAMKEYRDKQSNGYITYGKAFQTGFLTSLFTVLLTAVFIYVFINVIIDFDVYQAEQMDKGIADMKKRGMSDEDIKKTMQSIPPFLASKTFFIVIFVIIGLIFDTLIALIAAAVAKKNPPQY